MANTANIVQNGIANPLYLVDGTVGAPISLSNPVPTEAAITTAVRAGQGYAANTGQLNSTTGTTNTPLCIFNASSAKNILIYSLNVSSGTAPSGSIGVFAQFVASNPAYGSTATVVNLRPSGAGSAIAANVSYTTSTQTLSGSFIATVFSNGPVELLGSGAAILLPANANNGVTIFMQTYGAGIGALMAKWIEY